MADRTWVPGVAKLGDWNGDGTEPTDYAVVQLRYNGNRIKLTRNATEWNIIT